MSAGLVSCDWLALSCMLSADYPRPSLPKGWRLEPQSQTAVWQVREYLFDERGAKMATYLRRPKQSFLNGRRMVIEIANEWLYNKMVLDVVETCLGVYTCEVTGMPRIDLALDAEMTSDVWGVVQGLVDGSIYKTSTRSGVVWWYTEGTRRLPQQLSWGAPESTFHWKLYYKWRELWEGGACSKPYIVDCWRQLGMKENRVWRLECSIQDTPRLQIKNGDIIRKIQWEDALVSRVPLFLDLYQHRFVLRRREGKSNVSRNERVWLWGLEDIVKLIAYAPPEAKRATDAERRLLRKLYKEYTQRDKSATVIEVLEQSIGRLLWDRDLMVMWREMSQMTDREIHMRFPLSLKSPQRSEDIKQYTLPFGEVRYESEPPIDWERVRLDNWYAEFRQGVEGVQCANAQVDMRFVDSK